MTEQPLLPPAAELRKARRFEAAARHLAAGGFYEDAVSRAYYAVFHAACALLGTIGRSVRTHEGLRAMIGEHFIRTGQLDARFSRILARGAADRTDADYNAGAVFTREDAEDTLARTAELLAAVEELVPPEAG